MGSTPTRSEPAAEVEARIIDEESIRPLADADGPDCYPVCTILLSVPVYGPFVVHGWKLWCDGLHYGGSDRKSWHTSDGSDSGRPRVEVDDDTVEIQSGANVGETHVLKADTPEAAEELAGAIRDVLEEAYDGWMPERADDEAIVAALKARRHDETLTAEVEVGEDEDGDTLVEEFEVQMWSGRHCGDPVYAVEGSDDLFSDAREAVEAAAELLKEKVAEKTGEEYAITRKEFNKMADKLARSV